MEASPIASSSKVTLPYPDVAQGSKLKKRIRKKAKGPVFDGDLIAAQPSRGPNGDIRPEADEPDPSSAEDDVAGSSITPRKLKGSKKKISRGDKGEKVSIPAWQHADLARHENSRLPALWSADGRFYFKASDSAVVVHSANPPDYPLRTTLAETDRNSPVVDYFLHPDNPLQLVVALRNGDVKIWDWPDGQLLRTVRLRPKGVKGSADKESLRLHAITAGIEGSDGAVVYAAFVNKEGSSTNIVRFALKNQRRDQQRPTSVKGFVGAPTTLAISPSGRYLLVVVTKGLQLCDLAAPVSQRKWLGFPAAHTITCAAWYPTAATSSGVASSMQGREGDWFATGDAKGKIRLWHGLAEAFQNDLVLAAQGRQTDVEGYSGQLPSQLWHWHAHAVSAIAFGSSGATLLSGGEENTLVKWAVETGQKDFLPRLGAGGVKSIAIKPVRRGGDQEEYWVTLGDGSVVKNAAGTGVAVGVGRAVRTDPVYRIPAEAPAPLAYHAPSGGVVLPGPHPSTIQFYDAASQSVLFDLEVAPSNRVSRKDDTEIEPVRVERVAFSHESNGRSAWMATSEGRDGDEREGGGKVRAVKVWRWDTKAKIYTLNTHIPNTHGLCDITSLMFCNPPSTAGPSSQPQAALPYLLTTGSDGHAKLWSVKAKTVTAEKGTGKSKASSTEMFWALRSTFSYRDLPIVSAAVSPDDSLIALAHGDTVTLWDTQSNIMLRTLERGIQKLAEVLFVGGSGRWIVARGKSQGLCAWDLLATEVAWIDPTTNVRRGLARPGLPYFVKLERQSNKDASGAATTTHVVSFLRPETGETVQTFTTPKDVRHWAWAQDPSDRSDKIADVELIGLDKDSHAFRLCSQVQQRKTVVSALHGGKSLDEQRRATIWEEMFGAGSLGHSGVAETPVADVSAVKTAAADKRGRYSSVFDGPAYALPPVDLLLDTFLADFMGEDEIGTGAIGDAKANAKADADVIMTNLDTDASAREGRVFVEDAMLLPPAQAASEIREVPEAELVELTGWFKDLFSKPKAATLPLPTAASTPSAARSTPTGPASSLKKKNKHKAAANGSASGTPSRAGAADAPGLMQSPLGMPEFSARKRKEKEAAGIAAGEVSGQKRKVVPE